MKNERNNDFQRELLGQIAKLGSTFIAVSLLGDTSSTLKERISFSRFLLQYENLQNLLKRNTATIAKEKRKTL